MSTKEISVTTPVPANGFFDFPAAFDWFDELIPRNMFMRGSDMKPIKIEEFVKNGKLVVRAEIPGVDPDKDIDVSIHDGYLTIKGERHSEMKDEHRSEFSYGSFSRSIALPTGFNDKSVHAQYKDGILEVTLDAPAKLSTAKKVPINKPKW